MLLVETLALAGTTTGVAFQNPATCAVQASFEKAAVQTHYSSVQACVATAQFLNQGCSTTLISRLAATRKNAQINLVAALETTEPNVETDLQAFVNPVTFLHMDTT